MLQQSSASDYVIASGEKHSVREFVEYAFKCIGRDITWEGKGVEEIGQDAQTGQILVRINPKHFRPTEVVSFFLKKLTLILELQFTSLHRICYWVIVPKPEKHLDGSLKYHSR